MTTYYKDKEIDESGITGSGDMSNYISNIFIDLINNIYDNKGSIVEVVSE